jgi:hypothetical protein
MHLIKALLAGFIWQGSLEPSPAPRHVSIADALKARCVTG